MFPLFKKSASHLLVIWWIQDIWVWNCFDIPNRGINWLQVKFTSLNRCILVWKDINAVPILLLVKWAQWIQIWKSFLDVDVFNILTWSLLVQFFYEFTRRISCANLITILFERYKGAFIMVEKVFRIFHFQILLD